MDRWSESRLVNGRASWTWKSNRRSKPTKRHVNPIHFVHWRRVFKFRYLVDQKSKQLERDLKALRQILAQEDDSGIFESLREQVRVLSSFCQTWKLDYFVIRQHRDELDHLRVELQNELEHQRVNMHNKCHSVSKTFITLYSSIC